MERIKYILRSVRCKLFQYYYGLNNVHYSTYISKKCDLSKDVILGKYVYLGPRCIIGPCVKVDNYTMLGPGVICTGDDHKFNEAGVPIIFSGRPNLRRTTIGKDVWVGANSIILSGVTICDGAIIAAGTVVNRDIAEFEIHGGVPNKKIKNRFDSQDEVNAHKEMLCMPPIRGKFCKKKSNRIE